jgi:cytochrome b
MIKNRVVNFYIEYPAWDLSTRIFHWLNAIFVLILIGLGTAILYAGTFGISPEGKILLKSIHVYVGYAFVANLIWRIFWGFAGNRFARWKAILPFGKDYLHDLFTYVKNLFTDKPDHYLGHNPLARLMIGVMYLLLVLQGITGLILAGTDLYLPPLGHEIAEYVTGAGEDHSKIAGIKPGSKEGIDEAAYSSMRAVRKPIVETHEIIFYLLAISVILHLIGVAFTEIKEKNAIVSAMITGKKLFRSPPVDIDKQ